MSLDGSGGCCRCGQAVFSVKRAGAMVSLPNHLPALAVFPSENSRQRELCQKLIRLLEAAGVVVSRAGTTAPSVSGRSLISFLADADMVLINSGLATTSNHLLFSSSETSTRNLRPDSTFLCRTEADLQNCAEQIRLWLGRCRTTTPLAGAVLIGGRSSRMGRPKHLIRDERGKSWLERALATITPFVDDLFISGRGELPAALEEIERIDDLPGLQGPLAGVGALVKQRPFTSWLVLACDMPYITEQSIAWLLAQRKDRYRAVLPRNPVTGRSEPLLAWYDYRCSPLVEDLIASGSRKISELGSTELVYQPGIPDYLVDSWRNVNYPGDLG